VIKNIATVVSGDQNLTVEKDLTISTIVGCNTPVLRMPSVLPVMYVIQLPKMQNKQLSDDESCVCPETITEAPTPTVTQARQNSGSDSNSGPDNDRNTSSGNNRNTSSVAEATQAPQNLPSTGILDIPGVTAFGGGLIMAIVGLLWHYKNCSLVNQTDCFGSLFW